MTFLPSKVGKNPSTAISLGKFSTCKSMPKEQNLLLVLCTIFSSHPALWSAVGGFLYMTVKEKEHLREIEEQSSGEGETE